MNGLAEIRSDMLCFLMIVEFVLFSGLNMLCMRSLMRRMLTEQGTYISKILFILFSVI